MGNRNSFHLPVIDSLRGIAAMMVCLHHFVTTTTGFFPVHIQEAFEWGKYGVQIFFVISGVVIPLSMIKEEYQLNKFPKFLGKRVLRIEPPYLASLLLVILYAYVRKFVPGVNQVDLTPSVSDIFLHLGYLVPFFQDAHWLNPVYWTLAVEFQYYLIISLLFPLIYNNRSTRIPCFLLLLVLSYFIGGHAFFFGWTAIFIMGIYLALYRVGKTDKTEFYLALIICSLFHGLVRAWADVFLGLGTVFVVLKFSDFSSAIGSFFGRISYSVYLLHCIIGAAFINFMTRYGHTMFSKIVIVIAGVVITIISSYVFYLIIEKPSQKMSKMLSMGEKRKRSLTEEAKA